MLNKNYLSDNKNLKTEVSESFHIRMKKEKPELSESVDLLMELLPDDVYARAFNNIQTFNKRGGYAFNSKWWYKAENFS